MAQLQSTSITGSFNICNENDNNILTAAPGNWWYNPVSGRLNYTNNTVTKAWSTGGCQIANRPLSGGAGTQNAGLAFGGEYDNGGPYSPYASGTTQEYNGVVWDMGGNMSFGRCGPAGAGTQNEALAAGGSSSGCTEEYNGVSWATGGALIIGRNNNAGAGTQNLALTFGGDSQNSCTEEYNGTTWSAGGALIVARSNNAGSGTQNAGLAFGGLSNSGYPSYVTSCLACTEEYDGSTWSTGGAMITCRCGLAGAGTQNATVAFGGAEINTGRNTEEYNGTSWSCVGTMIVYNRCHVGVGSQTRALSFSGTTGYIAQCTYEWCVTYNTTVL